LRQPAPPSAHVARVSASIQALPSRKMSEPMLNGRPEVRAPFLDLELAYPSVVYTVSTKKYRCRTWTCWRTS
jgi:hypothetical protein